MTSLDHLELLRASSLEAPGLHDTNLNTLTTQTPRGQELDISKRVANLFFIAHEKGFKFHAPPKLAYILV